MRNRRGLPLPKKEYILAIRRNWGYTIAKAEEYYRKSDNGILQTVYDLYLDQCRRKSREC